MENENITDEENRDERREHEGHPVATGVGAIGFNESTLLWISLWTQVVLNVYPVPTNGCKTCWRDVK